MKHKELHKDFIKVVNQLVKKKLKNESIQAIILGGSVARGDETNQSDIDIVFYVKKKDMPPNPQRFYKFRGKYIEEHYSGIENLKPKNILPEEKILYDKTGKIPKPFFDEKWAKKDFKDDLEKAMKYQKLAEKAFKNKKYDKAFNYLYGVGDPAFILMHAIPPRFNLPFPSFRLLKSVKEVDKKNKTKTYKIIEKIYRFNNKDYKKILKEFKKAYMMMNQIERIKNPSAKNLGFYDKSKIAYNVRGLKRTFENYPFVYAYRFIVGCLTMWGFDKKISPEYKTKFKEIMLKILGVKIIDENLIREKINLSRELVNEARKLK